MTSQYLDHDWFDQPLPPNVLIGERSWLYSSFAFLHYRSQRSCGLRVGRDSGLYKGTFFDLGPEGEVHVGDFCAIVGGIFATNGYVTIGDYAFVAHEVVFADQACAVPAPTGPQFPPPRKSRIEIGENVWIGARVQVIGNVRIGEGAIIGAAAHVTEVDIPPYTIYAGNPARQIGVVRESGRGRNMNRITTRVVDSFEDSAVSPELWSRLLDAGDTRTAILTWQSQKMWWKENKQLGELLLIVASCEGETKAIAPLFTASGMAMNLCPVNRLDFIGDISNAEVIDAMLLTAARHMQGFSGIRIYFVPDTSRTGQFLQEAAKRLNLKCFLEDDQVCPIIDIRNKPEIARACAQKKLMLRRENQLKREGTLAVHHFSSAEDVLPQLDEFFLQHIERWEGTETPSKFCDLKKRKSFLERTIALADAGWLRFSRLDWNGNPIAFHRGSCFQRQYNYGRATFAPDMARYSPGTVLLRHLLLSAIEEGADTFDFGIGGESYKLRYATDVIHIQTWGLYPADSAEDSYDGTRFCS